jgi:translation initiation factor IF-3
MVSNDAEPVVISLSAALDLAKQSGEDLVEIANQDMPIVRITDYSKFRFEQIKKAKEAKKKQKIVHIKEVKIRPSIDDHDYMHKVKHAKEFLEKGDKVKITMMFRGRQIVYVDLGMKVMDQVQTDLKDYCIVERKPLLEGKSLTMMLAPAATAKPKKDSNDREDDNAQTQE